MKFSMIKYSLKRYSRTNQVSLYKNRNSNCLASKNTGSTIPLYSYRRSNSPISLLHVNYSSPLPVHRVVPVNRWNEISDRLGFKNGKLVYYTGWKLKHGCAKLNKMSEYYEISIDDDGDITTL